MAYIGNNAQQDIVCNVKRYIAADGQTKFDVIYDEYVEVVINGRELFNDEYTASSGTYVELDSGLAEGDEVVVKGYESFKYNDASEKVQTFNTSTVFIDKSTGTNYKLYIDNGDIVLEEV